MNIQLVQQQDGNGCGVACVAMVAGVSYEEVRACIGSVPITQRELESLLYSQELRFVKPEYDDLLPDKVYIMALPSLNTSGTMHYIVVDTRDVCSVYDPNEGQADFYTNKTIVSWGRLLEVVY